MNRGPLPGHHGMPQPGRRSDEGVEAEGNQPNADVADPRTGTVRLCAHRCDTCIFRVNVMDLEPGRVADMVTRSRQVEGHVVCHKTLGSPAPAIC